ncbi:pro-resilin-like [Culicoides brevitarsis]|uniref:pro-resilin-like n=1 Tax=Culicoides brevitarsis TaxID=469753 RepID=UPI00307C7FCD
MNTFTVFMAFALAACVVAEAPGPYAAARPSSNYAPGAGGNGGGQLFQLVAVSGGNGGHGGSSFGSAGGFGGSGGFQQNNDNSQTNEGQQVDPQLLEQVKQILLQEESKASAGSQFNSGSGGAPSGSYGPPSQQYGAPSQQYGAPAAGGGRVVAIELEPVQQGRQVASFSQQTQEQSNSPAGSYGPPPRTGGRY